MDEFDDNIDDLQKKVRACNRKVRKQFHPQPRRSLRQKTVKQTKNRGANSARVAAGLNKSMPAYSFSDLGGLKLGSACTGWCAESQALSQLGVPHEVVFTCDIAPEVGEYLAGNLKNYRLHSDVFHKSFQDEDQCDLLVCGAPCQPYSSEGRRLGSKDPRSKVIFPVVEYAERKKPMMILLEQVPGWETVGADNFTEVWARLSSILDRSGGLFYNLYKSCLNTADFGGLQRRKRLYVVAVQRSLDNGFKFPDPEFSGLKPLSAVLDPGSKIYDAFELNDVPDDVLRTKAGQAAMVDVLAQCVNGIPSEHLVVDVGTGRSHKVTRGRSPTLTATRCASMDFFSPNLRRRFTLSELARAQGAIAEDLNMKAVNPRSMGRIIGNAMSVGTIKAIIYQMLQCTDLWPYEHGLEG